MMMGLLGIGSGGGIVAPTYATLDGTPTNATLSGGNLTATHSNSTTNSGARTASTKTSGKYYFEVTVSGLNSLLSGIEILKGSAAYATGGTYANEVTVIVGNGGGNPFGEVVVGGANTGYALGAISGTTTIGVAVDFTNGSVWFRIAPTGNWNGNGTADPATNVNGAAMAAPIGGSAAGPAVLFCGTSAETATFNFGATAFSGTAPSGFTSGWPA